MHIEHAPVTLSFSVYCVCVLWGWGMWVGKILKMESGFVRAVLIAQADETTLLSSHKAFSLEHLTSATNMLITLVLVCVSPQRDHCKLLCHLIILQSYTLEKVFHSIYPPSALPVSVSSINVSPPRGVGVFRVPAEIQPPRKRVTWICFDPESRLRLLFLAPWRHYCNSVWGGFPTVTERNPSFSPTSLISK